MRIWIDLANSPHVPFFGALIPEIRARGHEIEITARDFAQTVEMARAAGLAHDVIGEHGGRALGHKARNIAGRALALRRWARSRKFDLAVSHNSYSQIVSARLLGLTSVTLMDYEHQPANHLAFRLASRIVVPAAFPEEALQRFGARPGKVRRYSGIKEDVYLAEFVGDPSFPDFLRVAYGITADDVLVVVRPPAFDALYHRFENELFDQLVQHLTRQSRARLIMLARSPSQREALAARHAAANVFFPKEALDGSNLVAAADLVVSGGGTMNREAAALGVPAATVYAGRAAAVDVQLIDEGRLRRIATQEDVENLRAEKKAAAPPRHAAEVRNQVADLILSS